MSDPPASVTGMTDERDVQGRSPQAGPGSGDARPGPDPQQDAELERIREASDRFFKLVMGVPENAAAMLAFWLPKKVVRRLDLSQLRPAPSEYISPILQKREADLVYLAPTVAGGEMGLHLHMEYQDQSDDTMIARCFVYAGMFTGGWMRAHPGQSGVPGVMSVVQHGSRGQWKARRSLLEIMKLDSVTKRQLKPYLWNARYYLADLGTTGEEELRAAPLNLQVLLYSVAVKLVPRNPAPARDLLSWSAELRAVSREGPAGQAFLLGLLTFVYSYSGVETLDEVQNLAREVGMTSILEEFQARGETRGQVKMLLRQLERRFLGPDRHVNQLPGWVAAKVRGGSADDLQTWADRVLEVATLEDVFADD